MRNYYLKIQYLYLDNNNIGDEGCRHLAPALAKMKGLNTLDLDKNNIGNEGRKVMREAWLKAGKEITDSKYNDLVL